MINIAIFFLQTLEITPSRDGNNKNEFRTKFEHFPRNPTKKVHDGRLESTKLEGKNRESPIKSPIKGSIILKIESWHTLC